MLGNVVITAICAVVVAVVVVTNTASSPGGGPASPLSYQVTLGSLAGVGTENAYLASIGARVRIVPLESWCTPAGNPRPGHSLRSESRRAHGSWVSSIVAAEAPTGATTLVLASQRGLDQATFQVRGPVPACLPAIASVRYW